jgi:hypothetical protein
MAVTRPTLAALVRRQVEAHYPYAACDDCLAALLISTTEEVRKAALEVARIDGFTRRLRVCYKCRRAIELTAQE